MLHQVGVSLDLYHHNVQRSSYSATIRLLSSISPRTPMNLSHLNVSSKIPFRQKPGICIWIHKQPFSFLHYYRTGGLPSTDSAVQTNELSQRLSFRHKKMHHHTSHRSCCACFTGNFSTIHNRHCQFYKK